MHSQDFNIKQVFYGQSESRMSIITGFRIKEVDLLSLLGQINASLPHPVVLRCKGAANPSLPNEPGYEMNKVEYSHNGPSALTLAVKCLHA